MFFWLCAHGMEGLSYLARRISHLDSAAVLLLLLLHLPLTPLPSSVFLVSSSISQPNVRSPHFALNFSLKGAFLLAPSILLFQFSVSVISFQRSPFPHLITPSPLHPPRNYPLQVVPSDGLVSFIRSTRFSFIPTDPRAKPSRPSKHERSKHTREHRRTTVNVRVERVAKCNGDEIISATRETSHVANEIAGDSLFGTRDDIPLSLQAFCNADCVRAGCQTDERRENIEMRREERCSSSVELERKTESYT